ncbi:sulfate permease [Microlunatus sp. Y2014]|uniref:sulfate permease n=1 Tax=Microlunatus sp. Y2014 TaxID=3418488 RepID=UPI003DA6FF9C
MIRLLWAASVRTRCYLRRYMPTNIALDAIRTRRGLKWGVPAMLLAAPYVLAASICTNLIAGGAPGCLNLLVLLFIWNAIKFIIMGPISLVLLIRARLQETVAQRRACADQANRDELTVADEPMIGVPR